MEANALIIVPSTKIEYPDTQEESQFLQVAHLKDEPQREALSVDNTSNTCQNGNNELGESILLKCSECSYETTNETVFAVHKKVHWKTYRCDSCSYKCASDAKLWYHKKKHHVDLEDLLYYCGDCSFTAHGRGTLSKHRREQHKKEYVGKLECSDCAFKTDFPKKLEKHARIHLNIEKRLIQCSKCNFTALTSKRMRLHCIEIHGENFVTCEVCHRSYHPKDKQNQLPHMCKDSWPMQDGKYLCKLCNFSAATIASMRSHTQALHLPRKNRKPHPRKPHYNCNQCPYSTNKKSLFERHKSHHVKADDSLRCRKCLYLAFSVPALGKHMNRTHNMKKNCDTVQEVKKNEVKV